MNRQLLLTLGKVQVAAMFDRVEHGPAIDDSEFLPLVEAVLLAFETAGISKDVVNELWEYAFDVYDQACKEAEPDSTTEDNRQLMLSYLSGKRRRKR
jgi:hypothetical protein